MAEEYTCVGCGDTGINSRGGPCVPCLKHKRHPFKKALLGALEELITDAAPVPSVEKVASVCKWAYRPRVMYAAGYRIDGEMQFFAGPTPHIGNLDDVMLDVGVPHPAYIVVITKSQYYWQEDGMKPIAKWDGEKWVHRRK